MAGYLEESFLIIKILQNPKIEPDVPEAGQFEYAPIPGAENGIVAKLYYVGKHGYPYSFRTVKVKQTNQNKAEHALFDFESVSIAS